MRCLLGLLLAVNVCAEEPLRTALKPELVQALAGAEEGMKPAATVHAEFAQTDQVKVGKEVLALLAMPRTEIPPAMKLVGKWRERSLQGSELGAYAYPFFDCEFRQEGENGIIIQKDSRSQRRIGIVRAASFGSGQGI